MSRSILANKFDASFSTTPTSESTTIHLTTSPTATTPVIKKTPSPRRLTPRTANSINNNNNNNNNHTLPPPPNETTAANNSTRVIKPIAVRASDTVPYNLRSRSKLKSNDQTKLIPSFNTKLSLGKTSAEQVSTTSIDDDSFSEQQNRISSMSATSVSNETVQQKSDKKLTSPPLTRSAAASAGVKIDDLVGLSTPLSCKLTLSYVPSIQTTTCTNTTNTTNNNTNINVMKIMRSQSQQEQQEQHVVMTRYATRKRKCEDDHRPYLNLLKMKQITQSMRHQSGPLRDPDDEDSGCDYDSPAHSPVEFTDLPPQQFEDSNMSYDSGFSAGSGEHKYTDLDITEIENH
ncbi:unnamed protein product [Didymodactylos carnosus]|uniref:Uncharacterized protein n=1 Tax=Didymodactylos carnosus TaxID=1234261 RepID=A0A813TVY4_9BILA|nr:unnamed protein product [Didymodactylos carnosus]CAF0817168.1 unnamed protein product [Didymodactylos carnosus]CAF3517242.1 unnamed protein product [Didymodactylos carnosus]CAF3603392.1 unnamed protein product [Didymodactylos carnosus]